MKKFPFLSLHVISEEDDRTIYTGPVAIIFDETKIRFLPFINLDMSQRILTFGVLVIYFRIFFRQPKLTWDSKLIFDCIEAKWLKEDEKPCGMPNRKNVGVMFYSEFAEIHPETIKKIANDVNNFNKRQNEHKSNPGIE